MSVQHTPLKKNTKYYHTIALAQSEHKAAKQAIPCRSLNKRKMISVIITKMQQSKYLTTELINKLLNLAVKQIKLTEDAFSVLISPLTEHKEEASQLYE